MAYRRRRGFKRRGYKKTSGMSSALAMAKKAWSMAKFVKSLVNVEKKLNDVSLSFAVSSTASISNLCNIAEGDDLNQRAGRSIKAKSLLLRGNLNISGSATASVFRFMVVIDTMYLSAKPAIQDILDNGTVTSAMNITSTAGQRFKVLWDHMGHLDNTNNKIWTFKKFFKLGQHIKYSNTTAADASGLSGQVLFITVSSETTNTPTLTALSRLRYIDN